MATYEQVIHGFTLISLTAVFNLILFTRVLYQKKRVGQQLRWSKNWRMMIQLVGICCLLVLTNGGFLHIQLVQLLWDENFGVDAAEWINPMSLCLPPCMAFVCFVTLKELRKVVPWRMQPLAVTHTL
jgi:hypothetical protein